MHHQSQKININKLLHFCCLGEHLNWVCFFGIIRIRIGDPRSLGSMILIRIIPKERTLVYLFLLHCIFSNVFVTRSPDSASEKCVCDQYQSTNRSEDDCAWKADGRSD